MTILISGPGIGLPPPQNLYPTQLNNAPADAPTNYLALVAGQVITIPAGRWFVDPGAVSIIQYLDPVTGIWRTQPGSAMRGQALTASCTRVALQSAITFPQALRAASSSIKERAMAAPTD